jgi:hypothetical protein
MKAFAIFVLVLMVIPVVTSQDKITTLEHKGTAFQRPIPQWLMEYIDQGIPGVEGLTDYAEKYCAVSDGMANGDNQRVLQQLLSNVDAQATRQKLIGSRINLLFKENENKAPDNEESRRAFSDTIDTLATISWQGIRKEDDFWIKQRVTEKGKPDVIRYSAYVLYSIPQKILEGQVVANIKRLKLENPGLEAFFDTILVVVLEEGLERW